MEKEVRIDHGVGRTLFVLGKGIADTGDVKGEMENGMGFS